MSEEALQIAEKRREMKGKDERKRYTQLSTEFQKVARRDKKSVLSYQCKEIEETTEWERLKCKEIEENNRMGKTRDLFKKI